ncbi:plasmid stabilization system protein ParE [Variovorax paradoxus]|jgi:toxin ParE1/3/4|uniref:type II toxin-antitoxin system RelE/ParE family toxin n=1 Tax=Variovorax paradoxus TaxID=34073 RepID=UPI0027814212|nr:type II toxin-antitoxin system RelE/ParE family toxin [Variovorax paradoxus]MDP9927919.1 plasmid stabilization system protein ParE [Variovorax paradoxus]MDQ0027287.1 plasmid stabilization system protein ParE [Variovorax paradoxus]
MAIFILPDAQEDLLSLQEYMLDEWSESDWLKAEDEIFEKLALVETGFLTGASVQELASVGILEYRNVFTSHHKLVYRRVGDDTFVYAVAGHRQDYPTLLMKRLLRS